MRITFYWISRKIEPAANGFGRFWQYFKMYEKPQKYNRYFTVCWCFIETKKRKIHTQSSELRMVVTVFYVIHKHTFALTHSHRHAIRLPHIRIHIYVSKQWERERARDRPTHRHEHMSLSYTLFIGHTNTRQQPAYNFTAFRFFNNANPLCRDFSLCRHKYIGAAHDSYTHTHKRARADTPTAYIKSTE